MLESCDNWHVSDNSLALWLSFWHTWVGKAREERTSPHSQSETKERKSSTSAPGLITASIACVIAHSDKGTVRGRLKMGIKIDDNAAFRVKRIEAKGVTLHTKRTPIGSNSRLLHVICNLLQLICKVRHVHIAAAGEALITVTVNQLSRSPIIPLENDR